MKKLLFASAFVLAACSGGNPVVGSWILDGGATSTAMEASMREQMKDAQGAQEAAMKAVLEGIKQSVAAMRMEIEVKADGTYTGHNDTPDGKHSHTDGTWTLQGNTITFVCNEEDQPGETRITGTIEGDEMRLQTPEGGQKMTMVLRRKKA